MRSLPVPARPLGRAPRWRGRLHLHRFRWAADDAFSGSSLYACRCGVVRPSP
ncbi:hypothetical protein [Geodermatophilus marinus]|uniref:hypothetical protein n=1 Tax=Geodermatophilus sp. LHW52908 TaxID=2303986 RepID=UPI0018F5140A|nr:hypothetical protein [Geodermatophilus sp. LHW52908]